MKSVAPENATALALTTPQYKLKFLWNGRPYKRYCQWIKFNILNEINYLELDSECQDLLRETQKVDGSV
jgi:hypothetical protein